jgi:pimeloyl-ACP methyl ester carboxylesterase
VTCCARRFASSHRLLSQDGSRGALLLHSRVFNARTSSSRAIRGCACLCARVSLSRATSHLPIVLIHGARIPGVASFDLLVAGGSLAADLATRGFDVYVMDVRGYGRSTRPAEMDAPPDAHPPLVRSNEAVRDIAATVDWIEHREHVSAVALFGWATGAQWAGYYASLYPEKVSALILLNALYRSGAVAGGSRV